MRTRSGVVVTRIAAATAVAVATLIAGIEAKATGINVFDNTLSDWGVTIADNNGSNVGVCKTQNCNPAFGPTGPVTAFSYRSEDSNDFAPLIGTPGNTGYVGPDYGGQKYDAEFLGAAVIAGKLDIGISSGIRPDNGFTHFAPGDILIQVSKNGGPTTSYALEVGGFAACTGSDKGSIASGGYGSAACPGFSPIVVHSSGSTTDGTYYGLTSGGETQTVSDTSNIKAGQVYRAPVDGAHWYFDPIAGCEPDYYGGQPSDCEFGGQQPTEYHPTAYNAADLVTTADYYYSEDSFTSQHAIIEASLDLGSLISYGTGDALTIGIFWGPSCGNDRLDSIVSFIAPPIHLTSVPAPGGALLYGLGLLALQWRRRRRARAA